MTIEQMNQYRKRKGYTTAMISKQSGIPVGTLQKIFCGQTQNPRLATRRALENALAELDRQSAPNGWGEITYDKPVDHKVMERKLQEASLYGAPDQAARFLGPHSIKDYLALPDSERFELIDGEFYAMAAPSVRHQELAALIWQAFSTRIRRKKEKCRAFIAPIDVQLDEDEWTMVQPDIVVVCKPEEKLTPERIVGAPDLIVEILSPATAKRDQTVKYRKYEQAGVREYWLVDPDKERILVYQMKEDRIDTAIYSFRDRIPVGIYDGKCSIDFAAIADQLYSG